MLENGNLISLIWNKSSHLEGMALTPQRGSTRHTRVEFIFEVSGIYRGNLEARFSFFFSFFVIFAKVCLQGRCGKCFSIFSIFLLIYFFVRLIDLMRLIHIFPHQV